MSTPTSVVPRQSVWQFILSELKPKGPIFTPFNVISVPTIIAGLMIVVWRFAFGLGSVTNLTQDYPWGIWIGFDVMTGVAFAGGAYIITFTVYIMRAEKYKSLVRATVLNGFLSYLFYAGALFLDLGRPWHIINPIIGNSFGYNSILFLVSWHFMLYMMAEALEFSPVVAEWLGLERAKKILHKLTLGTVIFGVVLSTLHQSGLGALYLFCKPKLHPLWYTEFLPVLFLVSSVFAGLSMIIFEGTLSHRVFKTQIDPKKHHTFDDIVFGLSKGAAVAMYVYLFVKFVIFVHGQHWHFIMTGWGWLYILEVGGLVLVPCALFTHGYRQRRIGLVRLAAILTLLGIMFNRLNISVIAFNWQLPTRYYPSIGEIVVTLMVIFTEIWVFRWVVYRMPVLHEGTEGNRNPR